MCLTEVGRAGKTLRKARVATAACGVHVDKALLRSCQPCNKGVFLGGRVVWRCRTADAWCWQLLRYSGALVGANSFAHRPLLPGDAGLCPDESGPTGVTVWNAGHIPALCRARVPLGASNSPKSRSGSRFACQSGTEFAICPNPFRKGPVSPALEICARTHSHLQQRLRPPQPADGGNALAAASTHLWQMFRQHAAQPEHWQLCCSCQFGCQPKAKGWRTGV